MTWQAVVDRIEQQAPASVMARLVLDRALPSTWIDEVFEAHRQRQYSRELLFSTVVELMTLVSLGLRPSLHAAARKLDERLPVSLAALYDKVKGCEPTVLRALVQGSAERLVPVIASTPVPASLPGWQLRVLDGNHLPASEKRLAPLRGYRGAALPGHTLVVYDPDSALVCDILACEDAHQSERVGAAELIASAQPQQAWIADRHFCTEALLRGLDERQAGFIVREHGKRPATSSSLRPAALLGCAPVSTGARRWASEVAGWGRRCGFGGWWVRRWISAAARIGSWCGRGNYWAASRWRARRSRFATAAVRGSRCWWWMGRACGCRCGGCIAGASCCRPRTTPCARSAASSSAGCAWAWIGSVCPVTQAHS